MCDKLYFKKGHVTIGIRHHVIYCVLSPVIILLYSVYCFELVALLRDVTQNYYQIKTWLSDWFVLHDDGLEWNDINENVPV